MYISICMNVVKNTVAAARLNKKMYYNILLYWTNSYENYLDIKT